LSNSSVDTLTIGRNVGVPRKTLPIDFISLWTRYFPTSLCHPSLLTGWLKALPPRRLVFESAIAHCSAREIDENANELNDLFST
jgi:hypothetical protein